MLHRFSPNPSRAGASLNQKIQKDLICTRSLHLFFRPKRRGKEPQDNTDEPVDTSTPPRSRSVYSRHWPKLRLTPMNSVITTGRQQLTVFWVLDTHTYQCRAETGNYPLEKPSCIIRSVVTVTISKTSPLRYTLRPQDLEIAAHGITSLKEVRRMVTTTTRVRLWGGPPQRHQEPSTKHPTNYRDFRQNGPTKQILIRNYRYTSWNYLMIKSKCHCDCGQIRVFRFMFSPRMMLFGVLLYVLLQIGEDVVSKAAIFIFSLWISFFCEVRRCNSVRVGRYFKKWYE